MKIAATLFACILLLGGCSASKAKPNPGTTGSAAPTASEEASTVVKIVIEDGKVSPQGGRVEVKAGRKIVLSITSDAAEEIHVHSDPEHTYEVKAGRPLTEELTIDTPGQVAVEAHHLDATIVQLVVEP